MEYNPRKSELDFNLCEQPVVPSVEKQSAGSLFSQRAFNLIGLQKSSQKQTEYSRLELQELEEEFTPGVAQLLKGVAHAWGKKVVLNDDRTTPPDARP